jgi:heptosyltransferase-2
VAHVVVVQTGYLGDVILTTPLLSALAEQHGKVDVVTRPDAVPLVETLPAVASVFPFDKRGSMRGAGSLWRFAAALGRRQHRTAYLPHRSLRSALIPWVARVPRRVGFNDAPGRWLYTETRPRRGPHETERLLGLTDGGWSSELGLTLTDSDHHEANRALRYGGITAPFVVVAPGSVWATKRWPYFRELSERISCIHPVVVIGSPADRGLLDDARRGPAPYLDLAGRLQIREAAAVIARADVAVTNDSAPMHLAGAVGTPVVAVFGPTANAAGFGPRGALDRSVELGELTCRPCSTHGSARCPHRHHRCMRDLPVDTVFQAVERILVHSSSGVTGSCE